MAEAVFNDVISKRSISQDFLVDSCGTSGYHIGDAPDSRYFSSLIII
jgi:low molecular weight phosphotyrosine protein phosphatase